MSSQYQNELAQIGRVLQRVERVCVLTGAGISAESGLPTYRGTGGLYNDIEVEAGLPIEEILHERTLARDPALTWKYISQIGDACRRVTYNDAHSILSKWSKQKWRTKSGKKSSKTGERYLPEKAIKSLSAREYARTTAKKRRDKAAGKQFSKQPKSIARKTKRYRT